MTIDKAREEELRIHALGASISRREWSEVERAHAAIRDEFHARQRTALPTRIGSRGRTAEGVETIVVPVEPTAKMRRSGRGMLRDLSVEQLCTSDAADTYRAMTSPETLEE